MLPCAIGKTSEQSGIQWLRKYFFGQRFDSLLRRQTVAVIDDIFNGKTIASASQFSRKKSTFSTLIRRPVHVEHCALQFTKYVCR
ncbi:hypothetical protein AAV32_05870 [Kerstersia gyiorum]|uniref:Uncharacterized protein n=1 Tax=Kerstersia gyiorum TaxID=206506 RepID=A0A171KUJ1_9BURK|nr:hypothetical protein AAV32_05870 [Kerstersia gyiorum]